MEKHKKEGQVSLRVSPPAGKQTAKRGGRKLGAAGLGQSDEIKTSESDPVVELFYTFKHSQTLGKSLHVTILTARNFRAGGRH